MTVAVITDTDASLPLELSQKYGIIQVPIYIHFGDDCYKTGIELNDVEMFARIAKEGRLPTTSAPAPGSFVEAYQEAFSKGATSIVCVCVSREMSATHQSACLAREQFPDREIHVIDSQTLTMAQGFSALAAAKTALAGGDSAAVIESAESTARRTKLFGCLATLKFLAMSGRVGKAAAGMAGLLDIKPILTVRNGKLDMLERVRTHRRAYDRVVELMVEAVGSTTIEQAAIVHAGCPDEAARFAELAGRSLSLPSDLVIAEFTPGLSVHTGPGLLGLTVVCADH